MAENELVPRGQQRPCLLVKAESPLIYALKHLFRPAPCVMDMETFKQVFGALACTMENQGNSWPELIHWFEALRHDRSWARVT